MNDELASTGRPYTFGEKFANGQELFVKELDSTAQEVLEGKIIEFANDVWMEARREGLGRSNDPKLLCGAKDVERATVRVEYRRFRQRRFNRLPYNLAGLILTILTGIAANWAFSGNPKDTNKWPWILLALLVLLSLVAYIISWSKEMEP
ncbi:MAG: hypothetical protein K1X67_20095 [Fimbriimonadaceae bacterium]|nr:hypothetical protein [Fimbriimonadaceae bacterium]